MSGILQGLGAFSGGVAKGAVLAENIEDMKEKRAERKEKKSVEEQIRQAGILGAEGYFKEFEPITVENPAGGIAPPSNQNEQLPNGLSSIDYMSPNQPTQIVQQFADGGMVQDPKSLVNQVNQSSGLDTLQPARQQMPVAANPQQKQQDKPNPSLAMSRSFNAMRDKAMELGRPDLAVQYQQAGFQLRDRMFNDGLANAQRAYDTTGDIGGFVKLYDSIDDGVDVTGYERTANGYKIKFNSNGAEAEQEFSPDQIKDLIMNFSDPAARYAAERQAQAARAKKTFETDEDIRKSKSESETKVQERDPYKSYVQNGVVIQDAKEKPDGWKNNIQSVSGGYIQKNADGTETFVSTSKGSGSGSGKGPKDYNKEMLPVLKEVNDTILGIEGMGTQDINTGKVSPTKSGNEAMVFGQRLLKQNPDLLPADVAKLAHAAATDPNATDYEVLERRDGTRYKRQVIKVGGQVYQLSNASGRDIQEKQAEKPSQSAPKQDQQKPQAKPASKQKPASNNASPGLDSVTINKTGPESFQFQEQVPAKTDMTESDVDNARQSMGLPRKQWYEKPQKRNGAGLSDVGIPNNRQKADEILKSVARLRDQIDDEVLNGGGKNSAKYKQLDAQEKALSKEASDLINGKSK